MSSEIIKPVQHISNPLQKCSSKGCVRKSFKVEKSLNKTGAVVLAALNQMRATSIQSNENNYEWHAVFHVLFLKDDFVVRLEEKKESTRMHIRSANRTGFYDFGINSRRIYIFKKVMIRNFAL